MPAPKVAVVIPARFGSTRFPGKPLFKIAGKPLIQHSWESARRAQCSNNLKQVVLAMTNYADTNKSTFPVGEYNWGWGTWLVGLLPYVEQKALFDKLLGNLYAVGKANNVAAMLEIDAVIDPADTRRWVTQGLKTCGKRTGARRRFVDGW